MPQYQPRLIHDRIAGHSNIGRIVAQSHQWPVGFGAVPFFDTRQAGELGDDDQLVVARFAGQVAADLAAIHELGAVWRGHLSGLGELVLEQGRVLDGDPGDHRCAHL